MMLKILVKLCYTSLLSKYNEKGNNAFKLQLKETTKSILKMEKKVFLKFCGKYMIKYEVFYLLRYAIASFALK